MEDQTCTALMLLPLVPSGGLLPLGFSRHEWTFRGRFYSYVSIFTPHIKRTTVVLPNRQAEEIALSLVTIPS